MSRPVRVLIAEDNPEAREALSLLIEDQDGLELAGAVADAAKAIEVAERECPDVALLDVRMPAGGCAAAARGIAARSPRTRMLTLSASDVAPPMPEPAVVGHLVKGTSIKTIVETIKRTAEG